MGRAPSKEPTRLDIAVAAELRARMAYLKWGQEKLAEHSGVGRRRISKAVYLDQASLLVSELEALCDALGLDIVEVVSAAERQATTVAPLPDTQADYAPAAEDRDGHDEADYHA